MAVYMVKKDQPRMAQSEESKDQATMFSLFHTHDLSPNRCTSTLVQTIDAPLPLVWSMVRCFSKPQAYKVFVNSCIMCDGDGGAGSVRQVMLRSGLPATTSTERLDFVDDEIHVMMFSIIGGDHRLINYQSTISMHTEEGGKTVVIESYVVDVPTGNTNEETCYFANTIIECNLKALSKVVTQECNLKALSKVVTQECNLKGFE